MMGTAKYLSPEQVNGDELGPAADIYSLGLVLYECLAGRVPFIGSSDTETALARLKKEPTPLSTLKPDLDPAVLDVIHRMLARRPEARIRSGAEAIRALKAASGSTTPSAPTRAKDPTPNKVIRSKSGGTPSNGTPRGAESGVSVKRTRPKTRVPLVALGVGIVGVLAVILAITAGGDSSSNTPAPTTTAVPTTVYNGPISITGVKAFDPESDDKTENDDQAGNVTDGDPDTTWSTLCYKSSTFGGKSGVGLVLQLNASALEIGRAHV